MKRRWTLLTALSLMCLNSIPALADVSDYLGTNGSPSRCPKTIVVKPELSEKNVFYPIDKGDLQTASNMIGSAVANKYEGAAVIAAKDLDQYKVCDVPVVLAKLKSYTKEAAIFGQSEGKAAVTILHFKSPAADAPDKQIDVSATGDRHWGDSVPFMNAIQAVVDKIQKTNF